MNVCVRLFCVCVVLCVGSGLATGWSPVQGVLPTVYKLRSWKSGQVHKGCRAMHRGGGGGGWGGYFAMNETTCDLKVSSHGGKWRMLSSGMWCRVVWHFVNHFGGTCCFLLQDRRVMCNYTGQRRRQCVTPQCCSSKLHGSRSQKTLIVTCWEIKA
jgi:hypothetical protein